METKFCPACGEKSPESAETCGKCGLDFRQELTDAPKPSLPLRLSAVGLPLALTGALLALTSLIGALSGFSFPITQPGVQGYFFPSAEALVSPGLSRVFWPLLYFALGGFATSFFFRRRLFREIALASAVLLLVQLSFWLLAIHETVEGFPEAFSLLFGGELYVIKGSSISMLPSGFLVLALLILLWMAGNAGGMFGNLIREFSTGKTTCPHCDKSFSAREKAKALVCPHCRAALSRSRVQWRWVSGGVALTALLFSLALSLLGPTLGFYYRCQPGELSDTCEEVFREYRQSRVEDGANSSWTLLGKLAKEDPEDKTYLILLHTWKYIGFLSLVFFFAPFLLGWRVRRGALPTAGITVPLSWLGVTLLALLFFDFGGFEGSFLISLRLHVIAFLAWGLVGSLGALLGYRRGSSSVAAMMEEIDG